MIFLLAGLALYAVYYMTKKCRRSVQYSLWGASFISIVYFIVMLTIKSGTSAYAFWLQSAVLFFGLILIAAILFFIFNNYELLNLKWRIPLIGLAAVLFVAALFLVHTAIPIFLYTP
ncbi:hypothetical protein ACFFJY_05560 [Fictibacillus aquaticus]|uniref:Uncharacterized protein n=1 Tax=Fictibacillus aquaticus TaxID=2021314 RepID=A0A235F4D9_9BACL|nr:hypothetical protein [Fictibacillus aquaticus]OYD56141.1 hypothetical protein CGZ90_19110 [Fictibacillus aquaticus]